MRPTLESVYNLLLEQKSVLETMLEMSREERRIIISGEASLLEEIVRREIRALSKLNAIEKKRAALHPAVSAEIGLPEEKITISAIAQLAEPEEREALKELQTELTALLKQHAELNKENKELIEAHFEYTEAVLDLVVDFEDPLNNFYGGDGKTTAQERKKTTGFFDGHA